MNTASCGAQGSWGQLRQARGHYCISSLVRPKAALLQQGSHGHTIAAGDVTATCSTPCNAHPLLGTVCRHIHHVVPGGMKPHASPGAHRTAPSLPFVCPGPTLQDVLRPFLLVCETKNPKLIGSVLGSIQKLLAHNAVSEEGRVQIIQALQQVRVCVCGSACLSVCLCVCACVRDQGGNQGGN